MNARRLQIVRRSLRLLCRYRLRSALLISSAALGVIGVVCSVNYGASGTRQLLDQIRRLGTNVLIITPAQSRTIAGRARTGSPVTTLVERDRMTLEREVLTRKRSSALVNSSFWIKAGDLSKNAAAVGCEPDYFAIKNWPIASGELFDGTQERTIARVAVLGHTVANDLFGKASPLDSRILINRVPFTVIGVLTERGQGLDVRNEDNQVYVPLTAAMHRLMNVDNYAAIVVELDSLSVMDAAAEQVRSILHQLHHVSPTQRDDFQIQSQKALLDTQTASTNRLGFFLRWIGASALSVSGLGVLGITWIAVRERTREIGTRRALGATEIDVFLQIAVESATVALTGGLLGLVLSWPISRIISDSAGLVFVFDGRTAALAFAAAVILNLFFSLWPSRKAAHLDPIEALRHE